MFFEVSEADSSWVAWLMKTEKSVFTANITIIIELAEMFYQQQPN